MPVSYTHLDVYKRQRTGCSGARGSFPPSGAHRGAACGRPRAGPPRCCGSVSYTHLSQADARVAAVIAAGKATPAKADAREAAYAKAVQAYQDQIAAREAAYIKAVLGK